MGSSIRGGIGVFRHGAAPESAAETSSPAPYIFLHTTIPHYPITKMSQEVFTHTSKEEDTTGGVNTSVPKSNPDPEVIGAFDAQSEEYKRMSKRLIRKVRLTKAETNTTV